MILILLSTKKDWRVINQLIAKHSYTDWYILDMLGLDQLLREQDQLILVYHRFLFFSYFLPVLLGHHNIKKAI